MNKSGISRTMTVAVLVIVIVVAGAVGAYYYLTLPKGPGEPIKIGVVAPYTGSLAHAGEDMKRAVQLLADEYNDAGGLIPGRMIELSYADTEAPSPDKAYAAVERLLSVDKPHATVGSLHSTCTLAIEPLYASYKIPHVVTIAVHLDITGRKNPWIFRSGGNVTDGGSQPVIQMDQMNEAYNLGIEKVAIFVENTDWGRATGDQLKATFDNYYPEYDLVSVYLIEVGQTDFYSVLSELKPLDPDFLFISLTGTSAAIITRQIREVGIGAYICGLSGDFDTDTYAELCGESLRGVTIAHMFHPDGNAEAGTFYDEYVARWPDKPPGSYAAECYAGAVVLFEAIERAGSTDPEAIRTELRKTNRQTVLIKPVKFDPVYQNSPINELFVQWVAIGERGIIWPEESKTMDPIKGPFA